MKYIPRPYQEYTTKRIIEDEALGALLGMGLGKTSSTLTAVKDLIYDYFEVSKALVIAPKKVAESTWPDEIEKWDHLQHLKVSVVLGTEKQRKQALAVKADVYTINRENVAWLVSYYGEAWPFEFVIIDELSSFKASDSVRFKALKQVRPKIKRMVGLTGTPASNGLMDLWSQIYLLDQGQRLGKFVTHFRDRFFSHYGFKWVPREGAEDTIHAAIADICISMNAEDYLDLPKCINNTVHVRMTEAQHNKYIAFEKQRVLELEGEADNITAVNAAVLTNKLLQYANGAIYDEDKNWHEVHDAKIEALQEVVESLNGENAIIAYSFKHDLVRIQKALAHYKPRVLNNAQDLKDWNAGKIQVLLAHPASAGHGLNLQTGGHHLIWFGLTWSLEQYQQMVKRLDRPGQTKPVVVTHLVTKGTMDEEVLPALERKDETQKSLLDAIKVRIKKYRNG